MSEQKRVYRVVFSDPRHVQLKSDDGDRVTIERLGDAPDLDVLVSGDERHLTYEHKAVR